MNAGSADTAATPFALRLQRVLDGLPLGIGSAPAFDPDAAVIATFLGEFAEAPHTQRSYRKEVVRFYLWCRLVARRSLAGVSRADVQAWERFLAAPPPEWLGPRHARLGSPAWRPLTGPLTAASRRQAGVIVGGFYGYLQRCRYLDYNPFLVVRRRNAARAVPMASARVLDRELVGRLLAVLVQCADRATDARARAEAERQLFVVRFLVNAGLRRTEFARAAARDLLRREDAGGPDQWFLRVTGKGGRERLVALNDAALDALVRWRQFLHAERGIGVHDGPLIALWKRPADRALAPAGDHAVYRIVKLALARAGRALAADRPADAAVLARASPHWLRHSYATAAANAEVPLELVRDQLGHASLDTTLIYRHREDLDRARRLRHVTL